MNTAVQNRRNRIYDVLGKSHGAAMQQLRKMVLFRQLKKHNENICVRCNKEIESYSELSIEHIKPWEGRSSELFWDLDNIAFSHLKCNTPHHGTRGPSHKRKPGPDGTAWCCYHEKFEPIDNFYVDPKRWNGFRHYCKTGRYERYPKAEVV